MPGLHILRENAKCRRPSKLTHALSFAPSGVADFSKRTFTPNFYAKKNRLISQSIVNV